MSFKDATDRLLEQGFRLHEIAAALGIEYQTVRAMRAARESAAARRPPPPTVWGPVLTRLAGERAGALQGVAAALAVDLVSAAQREGGSGGAVHGAAARRIASRTSGG